ncbi:MAG: S1 RNA-binding domain-containing protein [Pirellulales bacterium]|nr:S1 RNA-binding domain-containing protein [Pirellulales bacterium]
MSSDQERLPTPDNAPAMAVSTAPPSAPAMPLPDPAAANEKTGDSHALDLAGDSPSPRIKIGTQRAGVLAPKVEPRTQIAYRTPPPSPTETPPSAAEAPSPRPQILRKAGPQKSRFDIASPPQGKVEKPNLRHALSPELEIELAEALGDSTLDELIAAEASGPAATEGLEAESRHQARVLRIFRDHVFVDLGGRNQGVLAFHQFPEEPPIGAEIEIVVNRFNPDDGLYECTLSGASVDVGDWSDISEGITVDARITGHNKGGLECEVGKIHGFIPAGQISIYRVENFEEFVGQNWPCVVVEANRERRNLVLSRRAVLEREQAEAKKQLLETLQVGDVREGIVRSVRDFGAFVDLGGVDGMIHVSQMSWDRVKHPSEVLEVGQKVKVKIHKIDPDTHKISLAYRDLFESPWTNAAAKYPVTAKVGGKVSKIMDFGAFVKLEPGVEGLVHISELSFKRVFRVTDVVQEGQEIEAKVLSVDPENQRISLSMKALEARPEPPKKQDQPPEPEPEAEASPPPRRAKRKVPLQGGLGRSPMGEKFGLKW